MSGERADIIRAIYDAFNERDWDALFRDTHPEFAFTYRNPGTTPDAGTRLGREEVVAFAEEYGGTFDSLTWDAKRVFEGEDWIVVFVDVHSRPRGGDVDMVQSHGHLWRLRDDVVLSLTSYPEPEAALEDARLPEQRTPLENAELVRRVYKLAEAQGVEGLLELATEDVVWISDPHFPGGGTHRGKLNVQRWLRQLWIYDEISIDVEEIVHVEERALAVTRFHAVPADGPPVDWVWHHIFAFRDGRVSQVQSFLDRTEAFEAAGASAA